MSYKLLIINLKANMDGLPEDLTNYDIILLSMHHFFSSIWNEVFKIYKFAFKLLPWIYV